MTAEVAIEYINFYQNHVCHDCDPKIGYGCSENCDFCEERKAFDMAMESLEKQIPKNPTFQYSIDWGIGRCGKCDCGYEVNYQFLFCPKCGQKLDWREIK